ncbi:unnamed protein product [Cladocopium goreaui]|uniref:Protein pim1 (Poly(A)+ RNA transport protein 2) n=1 Tax=Cladocopium goreaui TaxID=2562237 RepID=A0A9P1FGE7_9DINO|nr:unnamed protein product [Cladocopium goreaui]
MVSWFPSVSGDGGALGDHGSASGSLFDSGSVSRKRRWESFDSHGNDESNRIFAEVLFLGVLRTVDIQQAEGPEGRAVPLMPFFPQLLQQQASLPVLFSVPWLLTDHQFTGYCALHCSGGAELQLQQMQLRVYSSSSKYLRGLLLAHAPNVEVGAFAAWKTVKPGVIEGLEDPSLARAFALQQTKEVIASSSAIDGAFVPVLGREAWEAQGPQRKVLKVTTFDPWATKSVGDPGGHGMRATPMTSQSIACALRLPPVGFKCQSLVCCWQRAVNRWKVTSLDDIPRVRAIADLARSVALRSAPWLMARTREAKTLQSLKSSLSAKLPEFAQMALRLDVTLLSGQCAQVLANPQMTVSDLRRRAQEMLKVHIKHLVTCSGRVLCNLRSLSEEGLVNKDALTATVRQVSVISRVGGAAFALLKADGSVVAWGDPSSGGQLSRSQEDQLDDVQQICPSFGAFAAVTGDGRVITWGDDDFGADSHPVKHQLRDVKEVFGTGFAFAALKKDGCVVTWGENYPGGDSRAVQGQLSDVRTIAASSYAFAAIREDGSVVTWGSKNPPVDAEELQNVTHIAASHEAFCALRSDGRCVTWGAAKFGGDSRGVRVICQMCSSSLAPNKMIIERPYPIRIVASHGAFAAVRCDGRCVTWGAEEYGGDSSQVQDQLKNVQYVTPSKRAFCAVLTDGSVVSWGDPMRVAEMLDVQETRLHDVQQLSASSNAFCAVLGDGHCITWGDPGFGGDSSGSAEVSVLEKLDGLDFLQMLRTDNYIFFSFEHMIRYQKMI